MHFDLLARRPHALPIVAQWYFDEWGRLEPGHTLDAERLRLRACLGRDPLPVALLALDGDQPLGVARVRMDDVGDRVHWLEGVYVASACRGLGLAVSLVDRAAALAALRGVRTLHVRSQVDDGGLFRRLGWRPLEPAAPHAGCAHGVMVRALDS